MSKPEIDLADPVHPRMPLTKEQADLLLLLIKVEFAMRVSGAVKEGGRGKDPTAIMDHYQVSDSLELVVAVSYLLLNVFSGITKDIACPPPLQKFLRDLLNMQTLNDPEMQYINDESAAMYALIVKHKPAILAALDQVGQEAFMQFTFNGPARA